MFGLAAGSLVAYSLETVLNPVEEHPCGYSGYYTTSAPTKIIFDVSTNGTVENIISTTPSISTTLISYISSTVNSTEVN